ncbi:SDR family NAD(P)-dependent oxidoreductase [Rhizobium sp. L1K21]|uniref:SDR family NAD(P)-dependent oxidoreductase n=1 Tax=Rhizobium sp. L1K21 TaxID=2954933 RepID=UPI002091FB37|nr:SDR family NAD(P)-dependent oxidoreductase [Rhizobium sp. L1K21]MCO6186597.1 SDR family NAD(P)-dependent oxidoreductase [Rhizobium sp. L1K21]
MSNHTPPQTQYFNHLVETFPSMAGKMVMITGCTSGTGLVLARTCGKLGAKVVMLNRPSARADKALKAMLDAGYDAVLVPCDLSSFESVRAAGKALREQFATSGCDVLCNNAGIMGMPDSATVDGFDVQMQANHLSHFLLTHEIWPLLEKSGELHGEARVINHSSGARGQPGAPVQAKYLQPNGGKLGGDRFPGMQKWKRYQQSKLANLMFTYALHDHATARPGNRVKSLCAHPGPTDSGLQGKTTKAGGDGWLDRYIINRTLKAAHSVEDGASGIARCACEAGVESGQFYGPERKGKAGPAVLLPAERNAENERLLWDESLKATGVADFFAA